MSNVAHKAFIWGVYVTLDMRGRGAAAQTMQHALDHAALVWRVRQVNLGVNTKNAAALRLHQKMGFAVFGLEHGFMLLKGELHDEHHMVCVLKPSPQASVQLQPPRHPPCNKRARANVTVPPTPSI